MRDLIGCLSIWLGPALRRILHATARRAMAGVSPATLPPSAPVLPKSAPSSRHPLPEHVRERLRPLDGHTVALVRPYLAAHERRVRELQRECRTALALVSWGIDYDVPRAVAGAAV